MILLLFTPTASNQLGAASLTEALVGTITTSNAVVGSATIGDAVIGTVTTSET